MVNLIIAALALGQVATSATDAKKEYDAFVDRMSKVESVRCALVSTGGPQKTRYSIFRAIKGGIYTQTSSKAEVYSDGQTIRVFKMDGEGSSDRPVGDQGYFGIAFGPTLCPTMSKTVVITGLVEKKVGNETVKSIHMILGENQPPFELYISKKDGMPVGWYLSGQQSNYETLLKEAEFNVKIDPKWLKKDR